MQKGAVIGIDKVGAGRVITEQVTDNTYFAAASTLGAGEYSAYFSVYNGSGGCDTEYVSFTIVDKKIWETNSTLILNIRIQEL